MHLIAALVILLCIQVGAITKPAADNDSFVATSEWQDIAEGQEIPRGLHVRINVMTGKKEAKLLDESETSSGNGGNSDLATVPGQTEGAAETKEHGVRSPHKKAKLADKLKLVYKKDKWREKQEEKAQDEFKSAKELDESHRKLRKQFRTDTEMITKLIEDYRNISKLEPEPPLSQQAKTMAQMRLLEQLNTFVHQIDNAIYFVNRGGLEHVLLPLVVNHTDVGLRVQAMRILGGLTQNNPLVMVKAFERNFGSHLAQILITSTNTEELSSALYAFGGLLRKHPQAQQRILSTSGTQALIAVLTKECELKIKAKAVTLIGDLVLEREQILSAEPASDAVDMALYSQLNLSEWLHTNAFCEAVDNLMSTTVYELLEQADTMEYFAIAINNTYSICESTWAVSPRLRHTLLTLRNRYQRSNDEYRLEVAAQLQQLADSLYTEATPRDEL